MVNGSDRQSVLSGVGANPRDSSVLSELESPITPARSAFRNQQPAIAEQPYELAGEREK